MKFKNNTRITSCLLCVMLIVAMAFTAIGCNTNTPAGENQTTIGVDNTEAAKANVLGEGKTVFTFTVTDKDGNETAFEIHTDKTIVGDALQELELIAGEMGDYGLYVKTVNGITADYDVDGTYWAFYIDGEYAMTGVDATEIVVGSSYAFKVEK